MNNIFWLWYFGSGRCKLGTDCVRINMVFHECLLNDVNFLEYITLLLEFFISWIC
mgnify:CR=1 FL=1